MNFRGLPIGAAVVAAALTVCAPAAKAQIVTLTDRNSVAQINTASSLGMYSWTIQGQSQLAQQWFWYRIGDNAEAPINTISAPSILPNGTRGVSTTYGNSNFNIAINYWLTGGSTVAVGQRAKSDIAETITINNTSAQTLNFHFFQYSDFDLNMGGNSDIVQLGKNLEGLFNEAYQYNGTVGLTETVTTPGASHGEAATGTFTLGRLNDGLPTTLNDNMGPTVAGDATWAFQWDFALAAGDSFIISKDKYLNVTVIPEPSSLAFVALGMAAVMLRKRQSR